ncbi:hypothetical protein [Lentzea terrae]|uniref:hypothetical protein n=1 Tax=Lentzea terrae TaxID=2200761 RepID=UPI001300889F|nr:hypothetical protein [Lentzea terrae]
MRFQQSLTAAIAATALVLLAAPAQAASGDWFAVNAGRGARGDLAGHVEWNEHTATVTAVVAGFRRDRWTTAHINAYAGDTQVGAWTQGVLFEAKGFEVELGEPGVAVDHVTAQVCAPVGSDREQCGETEDLYRR